MDNLLIAPKTHSDFKQIRYNQGPSWRCSAQTNHRWLYKGMATTIQGCSLRSARWYSWSMIHFLKVRKSFFYERVVQLEKGQLNSLNGASFIDECYDLKYFQEKLSKGQQSLQTLNIFQCRGLRSLLAGRYGHATSLEFLKICGCSILKEQCEGTGGLVQDSTHSRNIYLWEWISRHVWRAMI